MEIGIELDTYIRKFIAVDADPKKDIKSWKKGISSIVKSHFPTKFFQTFVEVYVVGDDFHCLIGFREKSKEKFGFINCKAKVGKAAE